MSPFVLLRRSRLPLRRLGLVLLLCGATAGLLHLRLVGPLPAPPVVSVEQVPGEALLLPDAQYRVALHAQHLAARYGVPGVTSPTAWEEAAIAQYERLALGDPPVPLACQRLGVVYGRRGYLPQAREMLAKAGLLDPSLSQVCASLALVYSDQPIPPKDAVRMTQLLQEQPPWIALLTLGDLARRLGRPNEERTLRIAADHEVRRFGSTVTALILIQGGLAAAALLGALVVGVRALFTRDQPSLPWYTHLGWLPWPDVVAVPALMAFCNALGLVGRRALIGGLPPDVPLALAARAGHYLLVAAPALALVLVQARRRETDWRVAFDLRWPGVGATLRPAALALGLALLTVPWMSGIVVSGLNALLSLLGAAGRVCGAAPGTVVLDVLVAVVLAPLVEEVIFRGFVFRALHEHLHPLLAASASALLFAAVHVPWDPQALVSLFALGLITAYTYRATRSLWPCIIAHAGYNACVLLTGLILRM